MTGHGFHYLQPLAALLIWACGETPVAPQSPAAAMLGEWRYSHRAPVSEHPSLNAGLFVTIAIDSAAGTGFAGRVIEWFVGDFAVPPDRFGPVTGVVNEYHAVSFRIGGRKTDTASQTVNGRIEGDVIVVLESRFGPNVGPFPNGGRFQRLH